MNCYNKKGNHTLIKYLKAMTKTKMKKKGNQRAFSTDTSSVATGKIN